jgi:hypothetical protein
LPTPASRRATPTSATETGVSVSVGCQADRPKKPAFKTPCGR